MNKEISIEINKREIFDLYTNPMIARVTKENELISEIHTMAQKIREITDTGEFIMEVKELTGNILFHHISDGITSSQFYSEENLIFRMSPRGEKSKTAIFNTEMGEIEYDEIQPIEFLRNLIKKELQVIEEAIADYK